jgi:hypothetical protein
LFNVVITKGDNFYTDVIKQAWPEITWMAKWLKLLINQITSLTPRIWVPALLPTLYGFMPCLPTLSVKVSRHLPKAVGFTSQIVISVQGPSWSWSYVSWIYNYMNNQCLSPLKLWVWIPLMARFIRCNIMLMKFVIDLRQVRGFLWVL